MQGLVSTLHRNSIDHRRTTALVSTRDTSAWEQSQARGQHDNLPVLTQACRMSSVASFCAVFPWPRVHLCTSHQEPDNVPACGSLTVSLCLGYGRLQSPRQSAFRPAGSIARTDVPVQRQFHTVPGLLPPCLCDRGLLGVEVDCWPPKGRASQKSL